ncbi:MAG: hypothetical protein EOP09_00685 [Proteobacteria bacterium]|nr:MAG: hypothetical protein EOP09_00685 [Pseudomonadota bacterium]
MAASTPTTLASRLKEQYNGEISNLVPGETVLVKLKFREEISLGKSAEFDVQLSDELGFSVGQGDVSLNGSIAQTSARASVNAYTLVLQAQASYDLISRASTDKKAFAKFSDSKFIPMTESFQRRQELLHMYGRDGIGQVTSNTAGVLLITEASWCPTVWMALKGAVINAYTAKTAGTIHNGDLTVAAVNVLTREVTVTGTNAAVVANDQLFLKGTYDQGHIGLMTIARNTGTLFGINAVGNPLWSANSYDVGTSAITLGKLLAAAALSANKGCLEKLKVLVPVSAFQALVNDQAALRQYSADYKEDQAKNGFKSISFFGASGELEIVPYKYIKQGEFVMFPERWTSIIGSSKMVNTLNGDDMIFDMPNNTAKEMRLFSDVQLFIERPGYVTYGTRSDGKALGAP